MAGQAAGRTRLTMTFELVLDLPDDDPMLSMPDYELEAEVLRLVRQEDYALTLMTAEAEPIDGPGGRAVTVPGTPPDQSR